MHTTDLYVKHCNPQGYPFNEKKFGEGRYTRGTEQASQGAPDKGVLRTI